MAYCRNKGQLYKHRDHQIGSQFSVGPPTVCSLYESLENSQKINNNQQINSFAYTVHYLKRKILFPNTTTRQESAFSRKASNTTVVSHLCSFLSSYIDAQIPRPLALFLFLIFTQFSLIYEASQCIFCNIPSCSSFLP